MKSTALIGPWSCDFKWANQPWAELGPSKVTPTWFPVTSLANEMRWAWNGIDVFSSQTLTRSISYEGTKSPLIPLDFLFLKEKKKNSCLDSQLF